LQLGGGAVSLDAGVGWGKKKDKYGRGEESRQ